MQRINTYSDPLVTSKSAAVSTMSFLLLLNSTRSFQHTDQLYLVKVGGSNRATVPCSPSNVLLGGGGTVRWLRTAHGIMVAQLKAKSPTTEVNALTITL